MDLSLFEYDPCYVLERLREGDLDFVDGVSEVHLAEDGRVAAHLDYWDPTPGLWQRIPLLGTVLRGLRRRIGVR